MKAVLLVPRLPGTGHTGDRLRAELHLAALATGGIRDGASWEESGEGKRFFE